jgi:hypothetical protein
MLSESEVFKVLGKSPADCAQVVNGVTDDPESHAPALALKEEARRGGIELEAGEFERSLLRYAAIETSPRIDGLPVHQSVKVLLGNEFTYYTRTASGQSLEIGSYLFATGCKVISLRRFPAGPMDWEISGFPRLWLFKLGMPDLARVLWFLSMRMGGFQPMFFMHVARRPKNRGLVVEKEVLRSYYRMARSLELQESIKGIMAEAWFHDPAAVAANPHLAWLNLPYREEGGLIVNMGPAEATAGFLEHNAQRKDEFESGGLRYRRGVALWPREAAIDWARRRPDLEA